MLDLFIKVASLVQKSRSDIVYKVNRTMVYTYFEIGRTIVDYEQKGEVRAKYGKSTLKELSKKLKMNFGKGFSVYNLERMRKFYLTYKSRITTNQKSATLLRKTENDLYLAWSHYLLLLKIDKLEERNFYERETLNNQWSVRELHRQYNSALYERLTLSRNKKAVKQLSEKGQIISQPIDAIKDPYVLEFLDLKEQDTYTEKDLESAIINKLEHFLKELGKGFLFVGRQQRIKIEEDNFYADLVFYNRLLRCFVIIDLKIGKLQHQDIGQMQMYVNFYDRYVKTEEENPSIGIILCKQKNQTLVEITLPQENQQIFASKYQTILPSKEELKKIIEDK